MSPITGGGGSSPLSISIANTSQESSSLPSSASTTGTSSTASGTLPLSPPTPDVLERGEHEPQQLQPLQPYTRKISAKNKDGVGVSSSSSINGTARRIKASSSISPTSAQKQYNILIKYGSLFLLVGQMVGLVLLMRYSRTHTNGDELYLASTAVFMMEVSQQAKKRCIFDLGTFVCSTSKASYFCICFGGKVKCNYLCKRNKPVFTLAHHSSALLR